ncbi:MAG: FtsH protease activity modulator HflK [Woeseiaceae bacterium]|nr:FtsH protease activity modulator HflK [Woeseiaceae bacterium]
MSWNESGNGKDPWKRDDNEPTDLDQIVQNWQRRLSGLFGGGRSGDRAGGSGGAVFIVVLLVGAWLITGFYRIDEAERGVVQRFGAYTETTMPGLRWHLPFPIESVDKVNIQEVSESKFETEMLTTDQAYVYIDLTVQYRRSDPVRYLFEVVEPELILNNVTESALRGVVGTSSLELLIGEQREQITSRTMEELQATLDTYGAGIVVTSLNLETVDYPGAVQEAVDDTQKALNDARRFQLEAETFANEIVPIARGDRERILQDAEAYKQRVIAEAEGQSARFLALLTEYQRAPRVTRDRLYIEAVEEVYGNANKVIVDSDGSGSLMYLPLDQLMRRSATFGEAPSRRYAGDTPPGLSAQEEAANEASRQRRVRQ